jgi:catechol 2,3-dioxygenase-like lactoylglutathione lyase family enzyme
MSSSPTLFRQLNLVVRDMAASLRFYRSLGLTIDDERDAHHVEVHFENGFSLELDTPTSVAFWDSGWNGATGGSSVLGFAFSRHEKVDETFASLIAIGARARQRPYDAFWGARYAIVEDPDGNPVALSGPLDPARKYWPPKPPPAEPL